MSSWCWLFLLQTRLGWWTWTFLTVSNRRLRCQYARVHCFCPTVLLVRVIRLRGFGPDVLPLVIVDLEWESSVGAVEYGTGQFAFIDTKDL